MTASTYDLIVIGGGPAGEKAAAAAAFWGKRVAVIDRADRIGGAMVGGATLVKAMREAALYLTSFQRRDVYHVGLDLSPAAAVEALRARVDLVVDAMADRAATNLDRHHVDLVHGTATLGPDRTVTVETDGGARTLTATTAILIATGSRPFHPPGVPFDDPDVLDSDTAALLDRPLESLVVVGGGAVGVEFASIYTALGAEVTLVEGGPRLLPFLDAEMAAMLVETFEASGMRIIKEAGRASAARTDQGLEITLGNGEVLTPQKAIFATGRVGNIEELGLADAGVATDDRGRILVDDQYRTNVEGIYAAGDVIGPPALASVSMEQARIAACAAFDLPLARLVDSLPPFGVYSVPEVAMVGLSEEAAAAEGLDCAVGRFRFADMARAAISGATEGMIKLVFERDTLKLRGVHVLGESATELVHLGQCVIHFGGTIEHFIHTTFNVPTLHDIYKYAAYDGLSAVGR